MLAGTAKRPTPDQQKVVLLEREVSKLQRRLEKLLRENLQLQGMKPAQIELNLPALVAAEMAAISLTKPGSERRTESGKDKDKTKDPKQPRKGHGPTPQPLLQRVQETFDLDEADQTCVNCGGTSALWEGHVDVTEIVDVVERHWTIRECHISKYRCGCGSIESALGPTAMVPGGRYTPEVAIHTAVAKYHDQIPLSRQVRMAKRQGLTITSQTLWDQTVALANVLEPVYVGIRKHVLDQEVVGIDESPIRLIQKGGSAKWQAWQVSCPTAALFRIMPEKSEEMGRRVLDGFNNIAVVDGASVYIALSKTLTGLILAFCWSHARRHFLKAEGEAPAQVAEFLDLVGELYEIERKACGPKTPDDCRRGYRHLQDLSVLGKLRDTESRAVIKRLQDWMLVQRFIPGGTLDQSLRYIQKRWTGLKRFLEDPRIPLDNNTTEAGYIDLAIGRRNYLGVRSAAGAKILGRYFTIFGTCRNIGCDPEAYLRTVVPSLMADEPAMLPHEWHQSLKS
jgi:transposase